MVDYARQRHEDGADAWVVQHVQDPENAAAAGRGLQADLRPGPRLHVEVGPVIGAHVGPGLLGVGGVSCETLEG